MSNLAVHAVEAHVREEVDGDYDVLRFRNGRVMTTFVDASGNRRATWGILHDLTGCARYKDFADWDSGLEAVGTRTVHGYRVSRRAALEWYARSGIDARN